MRSRSGWMWPPCGWCVLAAAVFVAGCGEQPAPVSPLPSEPPPAKAAYLPDGKDNRPGASPGADLATEPQPKAVAEVTDFNFGTVDPVAEFTHAFVIRNEGKGTLRLAPGATTCQCTVSRITNKEIAPGQSGEVVIARSLKPDDQEFRERATILTNDPDKTEIHLQIQGTIRETLGCDPPLELTLGGRRDKPIEGSFTVYSQLWESFKVRDVQCNIEGTKWEIKPADKRSLERFKAKSGCDVHLTISRLDTEWMFAGEVTVTAAPEDPANGVERSVKLKLLGAVPRRVAVSSAKLNFVTNSIELGWIRKGDGCKAAVEIQVNDEHRELKFEKIEVQPEFLRFTRQPATEDSRRAGRYEFLLEVPKDAPPSAYLGETRGTVKITTDHPKVPVVEFRVAFAVTSR